MAFFSHLFFLKVFYMQRKYIIIILLCVLLSFSCWYWASNLASFVQQSKIVKPPSIEALPTAPAQFSHYNIEITQVEIVAKTADSYSCYCRGNTDLPLGAILRVSWRRITPVRNYHIATTGVFVDNGSFAVSFGPFPKKQKIVPGKYLFTVFFSPNLQQKKIGNADFMEANMPFAIEEEKHQQVFTLEHRWLTAILQEIQQAFFHNYRLYIHAKKQNKLDVWLQERAARKRSLQSLRNREQNHRHNYVAPFFPAAFRELYALLNLLEDSSEGMEISLRGDGEQLLKLRIAQFMRIYRKTWRNFQHNAISMAHEPMALLRAEVIALQKLLTAKITAEKHRRLNSEMASYLIQLWHLYQQLQTFSIENEFVPNSNVWLLHVRTVVDTAEDSVQYQLLSSANMPPILYKSAVELLGEWLQKAGVNKNKDNRFRDTWLEIVHHAKLDKMLLMNIKANLQSVENKLQRLQNLEPPIKETLEQWRIELLREQKLNKLLASINPKQNSQLFTQFLCLCAYVLNCYDVFLQAENNKNIKQEAAREILRVRKQIVLIKKTLKTRIRK